MGLILLTVTAAALAALIGPGHRSQPASVPRIAGSSMSSVDRTSGTRSSEPAPSESLDTRQIESTLRQDTAGLQGSYGIGVIDLATGMAYGVNSSGVFRAASVNKMPILVELYQRAAQGSLNLDQSLALADDDVQHYGTGLIQEPGSARTYTLRELGALMVEASDNTAAYVLERLLGQAAIQATLERFGLLHTSMADNTTTPADAADLFASLYREQLVSHNATQVALTLLQHTLFANRLASGVPAGVPVAHKVGTDAGVYNDAGLVLLQGRPYAVAMLSQDADEHEAEQALARISGDLYRFESSLPAATSH